MQKADRHKSQLNKLIKNLIKLQQLQIPMFSKIYCLRFKFKKKVSANDVTNF